VGWEVARALVFKAQQGVKVRMLLDGSGSAAKSAKAQVLFDFIRQGGVQLIVNPAGLTKAHLDHRKIFVMDGLVGFTGGMNIGNSYQRAWHDQQTRLRGPIVAKLQSAFLTRWKEEGGTPPSTFERVFPKLLETSKGAVARSVSHDGAGVDRNIKAAYLRAIGTAQKSIKIANPYFSDEDVIGALCQAAKRHVKVQVVLPKENDVGIMKTAAAAYYNQLIDAGVEVYEYEPRMAHEKVAIMDGLWCTAGSSNLDARSLEFNDELNWITLDAGVADIIQKTLFDVDLAQSQRMKKRTGFFSWFDGLFRSVSVWL
jgi:cardiolipin synthase A/B